MISPYDVPGLSPHKHKGAGMIEKGLSPNGKYGQPCRRSLRLAERLLSNPSTLEVAWGLAGVEGENIPVNLRLAALTLWLARGRRIHVGRDNLIKAADGHGLDLDENIERLNNLLSGVEQALMA
jgi:hypothetical protein